MRLALMLVAATIACAGEPLSEADRARIATEVQTRLREAYDLSKPEVSARMLALYPDSGAIVSANAGRVMTSRDSVEAGIRYFWDHVGVNMQEPRWVWDSFHTEVVSADAAVVTATYRIPHRNPRGQPHQLGGAMTVLFRRQGGRWVITQEHLSDLPQQPDPAAGADR
jgi:ketosteroid isomerase-like protein